MCAVDHMFTQYTIPENSTCDRFSGIQTLFKSRRVCISNKNDKHSNKMKVISGERQSGGVSNITFSKEANIKITIVLKF